MASVLTDTICFYDGPLMCNTIMWHVHTVNCFNCTEKQNKLIDTTISLGFVVQWNGNQHKTPAVKHAWNTALNVLQALFFCKRWSDFWWELLNKCITTTKCSIPVQLVCTRHSEVSIEGFHLVYVNESCSGRLLGQSFVSSDRGRGPLQDEDHPGSRPHSFPGLYLMRSGRAPEWFRSILIVAGSKENHRIALVHLECGFPFYWTPLTTCWWPFPQFPRKLELCSAPAM